eukprot:jgi/Galph1/2103/GphlegSOOS_G792.1
MGTWDGTKENPLAEPLANTTSLSSTNHEWLEGKQFCRAHKLLTQRHPVEVIQEQSAEQERRTRNQLLALVSGSHVPLRMEIEQRILSQFHRLPGFETSQPGLDTILGNDETITFEDVFEGVPVEEAGVELDSLTLFEKKLGLF